MKRIFTTLFFAVALLTTTTASADVLFEYNFNDTNTWTSFSYDGGNSGQSYESYTDDNFNSSTGLVALVGGAYVNAYSSWVSGTTLVNLGQEIGQVLCLSGSTSIINGLLKNSLGEGLDSITNACGSQFGNVIFYLNSDLTPTSSTAYNEEETDASKLVKVTVELNVWDAQSETAAISAIFAANSNNNIVPESASTGTNQASVNVTDFQDSDGNYDPTKWMKYTFYGWSSGQLSARVKIANGRSTDWTVFIKSVTFETVDEVPSSYYATTSTDTYDTWTLSYTDTEGTSHKCIFRTNKYDDNWVIVDNSGISTSTEFTITIGSTEYYVSGVSDGVEYSESVTSESANAYTLSSTSDNGTTSLKEVSTETYTIFDVRETTDGGYTLYVIGTSDSSTTGITDLATDDRSVVSERYYNLSGVQVAEPVDGLRNIYIVVRSYDDGTTDAVKVIR